MRHSRIIFEPISIDSLFSVSNPKDAGYADDYLDNNQAPEIIEQKTSLSNDEINLIKNNAYQEGYDDALQKSKAEFDHSSSLITELAANIMQKIEEQMQKKLDYEEERSKLMLKISLKCAEKVIKDHLNNHHIEIIKSNIEKALNFLVQEQKIIIKLHQDITNKIAHFMPELKRNSTFRGEVEILEDNSLNLIDCHIEWQDGMIKVDMSDLWSKIERILEES